MELNELLTIPIPLRPKLNPFYSNSRKILVSTTFLIIITLIHSLQILSLFLLILPISLFNNLIYYKIIKFSKESFSSLLILLIQYFGKSKFIIYSNNQIELDNFLRKNNKGEIIGFKLNQNSVFISNHQAYGDWLYIWSFTHFANISSGLIIILKASLRWLPIIGPAMQFFRFIFINKVKLLQNAGIVKQLQDNIKSNTPFTLLLFPEATLVSRLTRPKSIAFAEASGIPDMKNTLLPRSTGLLYCLRSLSSVTPDLSMYDITIGYPGVPNYGFCQDHYTLTSTFGLGQSPPKVHLHIQSIPLSKVPIGTIPFGSNSKELEKNLKEDERERFQDWMIGKWREKDELMTDFYQRGEFKGDRIEFEIKMRKEDYFRLISVPLILIGISYLVKNLLYFIL